VEKDDLLAIGRHADISYIVYHSCFSPWNIFIASKGLKSHLEKAKVEEDGSTPRIAPIEQL
jgi:hypothetical protein